MTDAEVKSELNNSIARGKLGAKMRDGFNWTTAFRYENK